MGALRKDVLRRDFLRPSREFVATQTIHEAAEAAPKKSGDMISVDAAQFPTHSTKQQSMTLRSAMSGHDGWIWDVAVDPSNEWFCTASADQTIKIWSLGSGQLRLTLTGHKLGVRAVSVSSQLPYLFSGGEDRSVFCWDLEYNRIIRDYHGHRSGVYCTALHPSIPYLLITGSRDSTARVWDVRTRTAIHVLQGHDAQVNAIIAQEDEPQIITGSQDKTIRLWDITSGKSINTLTQPQKSVRALCAHPIEYSFMSAGHDCIREWALPNGETIGEFGDVRNQEIDGGFQDGVNSLAYSDGTIFAGYDSGVIRTFDYSTGELLGVAPTLALAGSTEGKTSVLCSAIDFTGSRLITGHIDKIVRVWQIEA